ncbi:MAG: hypothetical protein JSR90_11100 [Proteobacteria bacterium]|nr:hypothetical protein [Pseudomonadota bacterium]
MRTGRGLIAALLLTPTAACIQDQGYPSYSAYPAYGYGSGGYYTQPAYYSPPPRVTNYYTTYSPAPERHRDRDDYHDRDDHRDRRDADDRGRHRPQPGSSDRNHEHDRDGDRRS